MKDKDLEDSDELFDSTPESSDYYFTDTTSESDVDSDANLIPNQTKLQLLYDELDVDDSGSLSSLDCDTATPEKTHSLASEASGTEVPCSSQNAVDGVVVSACQKRGVSRVYNKRHYCLYCCKPYAKMARHLEGSHANESDVTKALSFPKSSKERKKQLDYIRNRGNYAHNAAVMESGKGELVPNKRPSKQAQGKDFMHCAYCQGLFSRKVLWRHMRTCILQPQSVPLKPGKKHVQSMCIYTGPVPSNMTKQLWEVISVMNLDPITDIIKKDKVIIDIGQHLLNIGGLSDKNKQCVREKMRELGRLVHNARRVTSLKTMEDCVNPKKYVETVKAVKYTCGFESDKFKIPSLAKKLGNSLLQVSKLLKAQGLISNDEQLVKNASEFQDVHQEKWNEMILDTTLRNIRDAKCNVPASDVDSDANLIPNQTKLQLLYDELDVDDSGSLSSLDCDTATPEKTHSLASEASGTEEPCSSQNAIDGVVVSAYQKRGVSRVYKRHYCLYCCKPYAKMARHLEGSHANESDVAKALSFPKSSKERKKQLDYIRNRGNYAHNAAVMESGKGELVPNKRPSKQAQGKDFMHCAYCQGLFARKVLWRHMRTCKLQPQSVPLKPGKKRVQSMWPVPSNMTKQLWEVISAMNFDPITDIIKKDKVIIDIGQHLLNISGLSAKNKQCVREKMRELGRLVHSARRVTSLKTMEDCVNPKKYVETVKAVKYTCGFESDKFKIPSLAKKLGNSLLQVSKLLKAQGLMSNDEQRVKSASEFQDVHQEKWNEMILDTALRNIREAKWNVPALMPFTEDVQKMHTYLSQMQDEWYKSLSESSSTKAWMELAKVCLAQIILFNRRRGGEVASMPLSAFFSRDTSDPHEGVDWALSEVEKKLCRHFLRIITMGKCGQPVPILLTPKMLCSLELLVKQREPCGVLKDNGYMFARPEAMTHLRGSDCLRGFAKACGAKCPISLTSTRMRKHAAILSTVLNMTETEMDQLANFLGHDIKMNREFCRLPEKTLQLAKICKVLMAVEQGRLAEFHGKNLDEIVIDPDGVFWLIFFFVFCLFACSVFTIYSFLLNHIVTNFVLCLASTEKALESDEDRIIQEGHCSSTVYGMY